MVNLHDTTFVIPVRIDCVERKRNIEALVGWILRETNASIIVLEADLMRQLCFDKREIRVKHIFVYDDEVIFYRTMYLNQLLNLAQTPIVGIWDADVIISSHQMEEAVSVLRDKKSGIAYPFDGTCRLLGNEISNEFCLTLDFSLLKNDTVNSIPYTDRPSLGGAFFIDKEVYLKCGGENENFYGWGPEDVERALRMEILGHALVRVKGPLFHLFHQKGDSAGINSYTIQKKNKQEFVKVSGFYKAELESYISSWGNRQNIVYVHLMCRIGNLMFQIAAAASIAKQNGCRLVAVLSDYRAPEPDNCCLDDYIEPFRSNLLQNVDIVSVQPERYRLYIEPYFHYKSIKFEDGLYLHGLFQSEKYLDRDLTLQLFKIDKVTEKYIQSNYENILQLKPTAINVRRGDYLKLQDLHPVCTLDYFNTAIEIIGKQSPFLVISDDVEWCKENFIGDNFYFTNETNAVVDLYLQTLCENNIISNSTFSWWGAWLNENPNKIVIAPKLWFGPSNARHNTKDLIPDSWIKI